MFDESESSKGRLGQIFAAHTGLAYRYRRPTRRHMSVVRQLTFERRLTAAGRTAKSSTSVHVKQVCSIIKNRLAPC